MAEASLSLHDLVRCDYSKKFVKRCADEFHWEDLSEHVVMDIGCGAELNCCKAILMQFPDVRALIAVDKENTVFQQAHIRDRRIQFCVGDIQERDSLKSYEGKMDKIISTFTFQEIVDKETAFQNVYRLLKSGGEAGFYFCVKSCMYSVLTELSKIPKFRAMLEDTYTENLYPMEHGEQYYKEMLERIGFKDVRSIEEEKRSLFPTDLEFKDSMYGGLQVNRKLSLEDVHALKEKIFELYVKRFGKCEGKPFYNSIHINLLGVKPMESSHSECKETTVA
ncbi:jhamt [Trichonephila clavata]|uniref:Jhamt n=1 Tax=Trichonephila clavata TaxID=2740835 RepID=A0A8X6IJS9_TRICU|nr:jhamt [Trichonephila clavata]